MGHYKFIKKFFFWVCIKIEKKIIAFGDAEIEKHKLHCHKHPILVDDVDINEIIVFNMVSLGQKAFRYLIDCNENKKVEALYIMLPKMSGCITSFSGTTYMSFL